MSPAAPLAVMALLPLLAGQAAGKTVPLKFAWPSPLRCEVEHRTSLTLKEGAAPAGNTVRLSMQAVRGPKGWVVRSKALDSLAQSSGPEKPAPVSPETAVALYPPFKVTSAGAFDGLDLTADERALVDNRQAAEDRRTATARRLDPNLPASAHEDVLGRSTERATSTWNVLVGAWAGKDLPLGDGTQASSERDTTLPHLGALRLVDRMAVTRTSCAPAPRGGCVKIEVTSEPATMPGATPDTRYHLTTTLVTDPRTLVPRSFTRVTSVDRLDTGPPSRSTVTETMTFRCK